MDSVDQQAFAVRPNDAFATTRRRIVHVAQLADRLLGLRDRREHGRIRLVTIAERLDAIAVRQRLLGQAADQAVPSAPRRLIAARLLLVKSLGLVLLP